MSRALDLYKKHSLEELAAMREEVTRDPANKNTQPGSIYLFSPKARKLLDDLAWAVRYHLDGKTDSKRGTP